MSCDESSDCSDYAGFGLERMNESDWDNEIGEDWDSLDEEDQEEDEA